MGRLVNGIRIRIGRQLHQKFMRVIGQLAHHFGGRLDLVDQLFFLLAAAASSGPVTNPIGAAKMGMSILNNSQGFEPNISIPHTTMKTRGLPGRT